jgi:uncharacterized protein YciI
MFIITLTYKVSLDEVDKNINDHIVYLKEQYALENFSASGRQEPRVGGIILSQIKSKNKIEQVIQNDPFYKNGIADYSITEFIPSMVSKELNCLLEKK